jgi:aspartate/methionine/tyrosine aminotransferase
VVDAGIRAIRDGRTAYAPAAGIPELREAVAAHARGRGINAAARQVVITPGAKTAVFAALASVLEPGDEVLTPAIGFPSYTEIPRFLGATPAYYALDARRGFAIDVDDLAARITPRTRALIVNAPHNPTGGTLSRAALARLADIAIAHDLAVITDEIYADLQYNGDFTSLASLPELAGQVVVVDGLSKNFAMTGWRLGYAIVPAAHAPAFERFAIHNFSCTNTFVQVAAVAALTGPQDAVIAARNTYADRATRVASALAQVPGVRCHRPRGAFYAFPDVRDLLAQSGLTTRELAARALDEFDVAVLPGTAFGAAGEGFLRVAFLQPSPQLEQGLDRLARCLTSVAAGAAAATR